MLRKRESGRLVYRDQDGGIIIGVFDNKNVKGKRYGIVAITAIKGIYKDSIELSIPEFERLLGLLKKMPKIEIKKK